jgi:hypothetical protein
MQTQQLMARSAVPAKAPLMGAGRRMVSGRRTHRTFAHRLPSMMSSLEEEEVVRLRDIGVVAFSAQQYVKDFLQAPLSQVFSSARLFDVGAVTGQGSSGEQRGLAQGWHMHSAAFKLDSCMADSHLRLRPHGTRAVAAPLSHSCRPR